MRVIGLLIVGFLLIFSGPARSAEPVSLKTVEEVMTAVLADSGPLGERARAVAKSYLFLREFRHQVTLLAERLQSDLSDEQVADALSAEMEKYSKYYSIETTIFLVRRHRRAEETARVLELRDLSGQCLRYQAWRVAQLLGTDIAHTPQEISSIWQTLLKLDYFGTGDVKKQHFASYLFIAPQLHRMMGYVRKDSPEAQRLLAARDVLNQITLAKGFDFSEEKLRPVIFRLLTDDAFLTLMGELISAPASAAFALKTIQLMEGFVRGPIPIPFEK